MGDVKGITTLEYPPPLPPGPYTHLCHFYSIAVCKANVHISTSNQALPVCHQGLCPCCHPVMSIKNINNHGAQELNAKTCIIMSQYLDNKIVITSFYIGSFFDVLLNEPFPWTVKPEVYWSWWSAWLQSTQGTPIILDSKLPMFEVWDSIQSIQDSSLEILDYRF